VDVERLRDSEGDDARIETMDHGAKGEEVELSFLRNVEGDHLFNERREEARESREWTRIKNKEERQRHEGIQAVRPLMSKPFVTPHPIRVHSRDSRAAL
jgi:hypothetical protein